jgi:hypothetical protein
MNRGSEHLIGTMGLVREEPLSGGRNTSKVVLVDAYGPVLPEDLIEAMIRAQDRILLHPERAIRDAGYPAARRAWAEEAVRWASADRELICANE